MTEHMTEAEKRAHLREVVSDFDTAMLVTRTATGDVRARPLALASPETGADMLEDGVLYFPTSLSSPKIEEIAADPRVAVTMQDKRRFVSISGTARILSDRALVDRLWSEAWKVWFPKGKDDPRAVPAGGDAHRRRILGSEGRQGPALPVRGGQGLRAGRDARDQRRAARQGARLGRVQRSATRSVRPEKNAATPGDWALRAWAHRVSCSSVWFITRGPPARRLSRGR